MKRRRIAKTPQDTDATEVLRDFHSGIIV